MDISDRFLTVREVAEHFRVSCDTVRKWVRAREVESIDVGRGGKPNYRILESSLKSVGLINTNRVHPLLVGADRIVRNLD